MQNTIDSSDVVTDLAIKLERARLEAHQLESYLEKARLEQRFSFAKKLPAYVLQIPIRRKNRFGETAMYAVKLKKLFSNPLDMCPAWETHQLGLREDGAVLDRGEDTDTLSSCEYFLKPISKETYERFENLLEQGKALYKEFISSKE